MAHEVDMETCAYDLYMIASKMGTKDDITALVIEVPEAGSHQTIFAAVYDGHCGSGVAQALCENFLPHIMQPFGFSLSPSPIPSKKLHRLFHTGDSTLMDVKKYYDGLTEEDIEKQCEYLYYWVLLTIQQYAHLFETTKPSAQSSPVTKLAFLETVYLPLAIFSSAKNPILNGEKHTAKRPPTRQCDSLTHLRWATQQLLGDIRIETLREGVEILGINAVSQHLKLGL